MSDTPAPDPQWNPEDIRKRANDLWSVEKPLAVREIDEQRKANISLSDYPGEIGRGFAEGLGKFGLSAADLTSRLTGGSGVDVQPAPAGTHTLAGGLTSGVTEFALSYAVPGGLAGKLGRAYQVTRKGSALLGLGAGAVADFTGFKGDDGRLSDLIEAHPILSNPVTRFLSSSPTDTWADKRFKGALEGLGLGAATEALFHSLRGIRAEAHLEQAKTPELRALLERQINESQTGLGDAIGAMESSEAANRAGKALEGLDEADRVTAASNLEATQRSAQTLEEGGRRVIPDGETIQSSTAAETPAMDVTKAFESKPPRAPGLDALPPATPEPGPNQLGRSYLTPPDAPTAMFKEGSQVGNVLC